MTGKKEEKKENYLKDLYLVRKTLSTYIARNVSLYLKETRKLLKLEVYLVTILHIQVYL